MTTAAKAEDPKPGLITKLSTIMGELKDIPKTGFNEHQKYAFRKADDVDAAVSKELAKHNVILWFNCTSQILTPLYKTASGSTMWLATVEVEYQFIDGATGEVSPVSMVPGTGADTGDKAHAKAMTMSKKYFLGQVFLIGGNDDPEADEKVDRAAAASGAASGGRTVVAKADHGPVGKGGRSPKATEAQLAEVKRLAKELGLTTGSQVAALVAKAANVTAPDGDTAAFLRSLTAVQIGGAIVAMTALVDEVKAAEDDVTDDVIETGDADATSAVEDDLDLG